MSSGYKVCLCTAPKFNPDACKYCSNNPDREPIVIRTGATDFIDTSKTAGVESSRFITTAGG